MILLQVMRGAKWVSVSTLSVLRKGDVYRTRTGLNSWGEPKTAQAHARRRPHPSYPDVTVWMVDGMVETIKR
jgi:hypothetical protein